jgi:hypothetical protein
MFTGAELSSKGLGDWKLLLSNRKFDSLLLPPFVPMIGVLLSSKLEYPSKPVPCLKRGLLVMLGDVGPSSKDGILLGALNLSPCGLIGAFGVRA